MYIYVLLAVILSLFLWYRRRQYQMSLFQRLNIPGPEPHLITGNLKEFREKGTVECQLQWTKKYGKILGYYLGAKPILLVSDTELLKYVQAKNFQDFIDRPVFPSDRGIPDHRIFQAVTFQGGRRWKEIRSLLTPGFTTNKIKQMTGTINSAAKVLVEIIKDKAGKKERLDVTDLFRGFALDVIERTVFGIQTDAQYNSSGLYQQSIRIVTDNSLSKRMFLMVVCLPELELIYRTYSKIVDTVRNILGLPSVRYVFHKLEEIIKTRRAKKITRPDMLQILIDANMSEHQIQNMTGKQLSASLEDDNEENTMKARTSSKVCYMTDDEVMANALAFMIAGHHTINSALSFVLYLLARHPEVQEKLRKEINSILEKEELDYSAVNKMNYLQQVISETLRLYPIVLMLIFRTVGKSFSYKNLYLPKGLTIQPALWPMHRDPELWENADKFDPERFSSERKSEINMYAYQPFGAGPRNCIGLRLAYVLMKLVLVQLLHSFKFVEEGGPNQGDLKLEYLLLLIRPVNDRIIKAVEVRSN